MRDLTARAKLDGAGAQVLAALPRLGEYETVLYIGANTRRFHLYGLFDPAGLYVVEIFALYVEALRACKRRPCAGVFLGDVRRLDEVPEIPPLKPFDLLVWWHGPEHMPQEELRRLLAPESSLHSWWRRAILLGCPWGRHEDAGIDGNAHQAHQCHLYPEFFTDLGYSVSVKGTVDVPGKNNLAAWKVKEGER